MPLAYGQGDVNPIVSQMSQAAVKAIANCRLLIADLVQIRSSWEERIAARRGSVTWNVVDLLLRRPVIDARTLGAEVGTSA